MEGLPGLVFDEVSARSPTAMGSEVWRSIGKQAKSECVEALTELTKAIRGGWVTGLDQDFAKEILEVLRDVDKRDLKIQLWDKPQIEMLLTALVSG